MTTNPTLTLAILELREYERNDGLRAKPHRSLPLVHLDEDRGIFELAQPFPANLRIIEEIDLNTPEHACNRDIVVPRCGDVLLGLAVAIERGAAEDDAELHHVELYQGRGEHKVLFARAPCEPGRLVHVVPFPHAGLNLLQIGASVYVAVVTRSGRQRCCTGRLLLMYAVLPSESRRALATWTTKGEGKGKGDEGVGYVHRDGRVFRAQSASGFLFSSPSIVLPDVAPKTTSSTTA